MKTVDLHTHSNISDGSMTPEELMRHARRLRSVRRRFNRSRYDRRYCPGASGGPSAHIEFIPGIEFAAYYKDREVHIVGLFINEQTPEFIDAVQQTAADRDARNGAMIQKMREAGIDITLEALHKEEGRGVLTRANFASCLVRRGIVSSNQEAFDKYLGKDKPFYVPRKKLKPEDAIRRIHEAGGIAVLAHPLLYHFTDTQLDQCVCDLKAMGIQALEAYYSKTDSLTPTV